MSERIQDFIFEWMILLPFSICEGSKYKIVRVVGLITTIPWLVVTLIPFGFLYLFFAFCELVEEI